jgi:hypothetical protein
MDNTNGYYALTTPDGGQTYNGIPINNQGADVPSDGRFISTRISDSNSFDHDNIRMG